MRKRILILGAFVLLVPALALLPLTRREYNRLDEPAREAYVAGVADGLEAAAFLLRNGLGPRTAIAALEALARDPELGDVLAGRAEPLMDHALIGEAMKVSCRWRGC